MKRPRDPSPAQRLRLRAVDVLDRAIRYPRTAGWEEVECAVDEARRLLGEARQIEAGAEVTS